jgi:hypothetical protein
MNRDEHLWVALTVGRPNRQYVFRHGTSSRYEALYRCSLIRMALEQRGVTAYGLRRTTAARTLDPSEKDAVNYFLGMMLCELFYGKFLNLACLLYPHVVCSMLSPILKTSFCLICFVI